jgi:DNA polymerase elongation subunit (family B)
VWGEYPIVFADTLNYFKVSLSSLGKSMGFPKFDMPLPSDSDLLWSNYCKRDVEVTAMAVEKLVDFTRANKLGPWQATIAGMSFSAYKHRFMPVKVLVHCVPSVLKMERGAYYGGIVDTCYIGKVPTDKVYELDVCSMYPHVCTFDLPYKLKWVGDNITQLALAKGLRRYMGVADVTVCSNSYLFPYRTKERIYYPTGEFRTCLADAELRIALTKGHIRKIHKFAFYHKAPIFAEYMRFFVGRKTLYRAAGDESFATMCKLFANSLYGKTGQQSPRWLQWGEDAMRLLEKRYDLPVGALSLYDDYRPKLATREADVVLQSHNLTVQVRDYFDCPEVAVGEHESRDSCPAIAACVTAYARVLLREYQSIAGEGNWYYSDTDSIWTNLTGYERLLKAGHIEQDVLGKLSLKHVHDYLIVHGPKDYETPAGVTLKGVKPTLVQTPDGYKKEYVRTADGGYLQKEFPGIRAQLSTLPPDVSSLGYTPDTFGVFVADVVKHLRRTLNKCVKLDTNWTRPMRVDEIVT